MCALALILMSSLFVEKGISQCSNNDPTVPVGIVPGFVAGSPTLCAGGIRIDPPVAGTYALDGFGNTITIAISSGSCGQIFSWTASSDVVVDIVIAKGGPFANVYDYTTISPRPGTDGNLHSPVVSSGFYADLSHIDFCYHYRLKVSKTATTSYTRTYGWCISKSCNGPSTITLSPGQQYAYPFSWTASVCSSTDGNWTVTGAIQVSNNTPFASTITGIADILDGGVAATLNCGLNFPYVLASGAVLNCTYTASLLAGTDGTNTVTVTTSTPNVEGSSATAPYHFGNPTTLVDDCITVQDNCTAPVVLCVGNAPYTRQYTCNIGPYEGCLTQSFTNTAGFTTDDTGTTGSDQCAVSVVLACDVNGGCTLTPGYWKTHSEFGPAPYDDTWAQLPQGASSPFFLSGKSYHQVLWTPPAGNAYYILAHAWIAARLNQLNGASIPPQVLTAYNTAKTLFQTYTPAQIAALKGNNPLRQQFISLAGILDAYNNGLTGPGHCSEDGSGNGNLTIKPLTGAIAAEDNTTISVQAFPNPFEGELEFLFTIPYDSYASLRILDLNGK